MARMMRFHDGICTFEHKGVHHSSSGVSIQGYRYMWTRWKNMRISTAPFKRQQPYSPEEQYQESRVPRQNHHKAPCQLPQTLVHMLIFVCYSVGNGVSLSHESVPRCWAPYVTSFGDAIYLGEELCRRITLSDNRFNFLLYSCEVCFSVIAVYIHCPVLNVNA